MSESFKQQLPDIDPQETKEWLEALDGVLERDGQSRAQFGPVLAGARPQGGDRQRLEHARERAVGTLGVAEQALEVGGIGLPAAELDQQPGLADAGVALQQDLQAGRREKLTQARASALLLHLADHLFTAPVITIPEAQRILDVTYPTAQRNVARLESVGILRQVGESRYGKTFIAHEIMRVVGTNER